MVYYFLGILTGLVIAVIVAVITFHYKPAIGRIVNQVSSKMNKKGRVIESTEDSEVEDWINELKEK